MNESKPIVRDVECTTHDWERLVWDHSTQTFKNVCKRCGYEEEIDVDEVAEWHEHWEGLEDDEAARNLGIKKLLGECVD